MSTISKFKKNVAYGYIIQIITIILVFINRTIFIKVLGMEIFGLDNLFKEILSFISLADLGLESAMSYAFYKPLADKNQKQLSNIYVFFSRVYRYIGCAVLIIGLCILPFLKSIMHNNIFKIEYNIYFLIILFYNSVRYFYLHKVILLNADQKSHINSKLGTALFMTRSFIQLIVLMIFKNFLLYLIVDVFIAVLYLISYAKIIKSNYNIDYSQKSLDLTEKSGLFGNLYAASIFRFSNALLSSTDNTLISIFIGMETIGIVASYKLLFQTAYSFYSVIFAQSISFIGNFLVTSKNNDERAKIYFDLNIINFAGITVLLPCIYACVNDFVIIWLGKNNVLTNAVLLALLFDLYLNLSTQINMVFRESSGIFVKTKHHILFSSIINIILSITLSKFFGLFGILFATPISRMVGYLFKDIQNVHKYVIFTNSNTFYSEYLKNFISMVIIFFIVYKINISFNIVNIYYLVFKGLIMLVVLSIVSFLLYYTRLRNNFIYKKVLKR